MQMLWNIQLRENDDELNREIKQVYCVVLKAYLEFEDHSRNTGKNDFTVDGSNEKI